MNHQRRFCDNCGKEISEHEKFCIYCGHQLSDMIGNNAVSTTVSKPTVSKQSGNAKSLVSVIGVIAVIVVVLCASVFLKDNISDIISGEDEVVDYTHKTIWNDYPESATYENDFTTEQSRISSTTSAKAPTEKSTTKTSARTTSSKATQHSSSRTTKTTTTTTTRTTTTTKTSTTTKKTTTTTTKKPTTTTTKKRAPDRYDIKSVADEVKSYGLSRGLTYGKGNRYICTWGLSTDTTPRNNLVEAAKWVLEDDHPYNDGATHFIVRYGECNPQKYDDYTDYYLQIDLYH